MTLSQDQINNNNNYSTMNSTNEEKNNIDDDNDNDDIINRIFGQQPIPYLELIAGMKSNNIKQSINKNKIHHHLPQPSSSVVSPKLQQQETIETPTISTVPVVNNKNNSKSSNVPVKAVPVASVQVADDIQLLQREQMEEAISQMVQQMKIKTTNLHTTITKQTSNIVNELETITEDNVQAVTTLATNTTKQLSKSWKSTISTYITIISIVCIFIFILLTIIVIPKNQKQKQKIVYVVQKQKPQPKQQPTSLPKIIEYQQPQKQHQQSIDLLDLNSIEIQPYSEKYKSVPVSDSSMLLLSNPVANDIHPIEIQPYSDKYGQPPTTARTIVDDVDRDTASSEHPQQQQPKYNDDNSATNYFRGEL